MGPHALLGYGGQPLDLLMYLRTDMASCLVLSVAEQYKHPDHQQSDHAQRMTLDGIHHEATARVDVSKLYKIFLVFPDIN